MTIEVEANEFCPDNCPYYMDEVTAEYDAEVKNLSKFKHACRSRERCRFVYELSGKQNDNAEEKTPKSQETKIPQQLVHITTDPRDLTAFYKCPVCGEKYASVWYMALEDKFVCKCGTPVYRPDYF